MDGDVSYSDSYFFFFFSSRRRHTRLQGDWSSDVCSSDLPSVRCLFFQSPEIHCRHAFFIHFYPYTAPGSWSIRSGKNRGKNLTARKEEIGRASCRERV